MVLLRFLFVVFRQKTAYELRISVWSSDVGSSDRRPALRPRLDGDGTVQRSGPHPLDRDRAAAGADVPEQLAGMRGQRRQGDRPDLALGELAVVPEDVVGQAAEDRKSTRLNSSH